MESRRVPKPFSAAAFGLLVAVGVGSWAATSCGSDSSVGLHRADLELVVVGGNGQGALLNEPLSNPLQVRVQTAGNASARDGIPVRWEVVAGGDARLSDSRTVSDSFGLGQVRVTMGAEPGPLAVRAWIGGTQDTGVRFDLMGMQAPPVFTISDIDLVAGDTVSLSGSGFGASPDDNVVTFTGIPARVVAASLDRLDVVVPPCLLTREYGVEVGVGGVLSDPVHAVVQAGPAPVPLSVGEDLFLEVGSEASCAQLPGVGGARYLVVPHSTATVGEMEHPYSLMILAPGAVPPSTVALNRGAGASGPDRAASHPPDDHLRVQGAWDDRVRNLEREAFRSGGLGVPAGSGVQGFQRAADELPEVGSVRTFTVLNAKEKFDRVQASLRFITEHSLVYLDESVPAGGFDDVDLAELAQEFEGTIYPAVTEAFGEPSDIDGDGRVIILFTSAVNRLTDQGSDGFVAGFFYGLDLAEGVSGANGGEIFYAVVPDPAGKVGPVVSRLTAMTTIPPVLAHEFEHMIHFRARMMDAGAETQDALWLTEGLALMAEELVARAHLRKHRPNRAQQYRNGNLVRARRYLADPGGVGPLASRSPGTLAERGGWWLFLQQVFGRVGAPDLLGHLASSRQVGSDNLAAATGIPWEDAVGCWAGSLYLDGTGTPTRAALDFEGFDLRSDLASPDGSYVLPVLGPLGGSTLVSGTLWSSAANYLIISPPEGGLVLGASGLPGLRPEPAMGLRVLVVRLQ